MLCGPGWQARLPSAAYNWKFRRAERKLKRSEKRKVKALHFQKVPWNTQEKSGESCSKSQVSPEQCGGFEIAPHP